MFNIIRDIELLLTNFNYSSLKDSDYVFRFLFLNFNLFILNLNMY